MMQFHELSLSKRAALEALPTPCYVLDEARLLDNLHKIDGLQRRTGAKVLLAQKCFATTSLYPLLSRHLAGTASSGLYEARLADECFHGENHVFEPAYRRADMEELSRICDHIVFNSWSQFELHRSVCMHNSLGLRINPECSTQPATHAIYDPCTPGSRLGIRCQDMPAKLPPEIQGLHFHTLCEQNAGDLETTFAAVEAKFAPYLRQVQWLNLGGGHYLAHPDYELERLESLLHYIYDQYGLQVYLEPGEGIVLNAGYLVTEVLDKVKNGLEILILDASAACHFPDVLEGPYLPPIYGGYEVPGGNALRDGYVPEHPYLYRLASCTCLAGDVIGDYTFDESLKVGSKLILQDMALYTIVKNNTFNGMPLPAIRLLHEDGSVELLKKFGYEDFKYRLG